MERYRGLCLQLWPKSKAIPDFYEQFLFRLEEDGRFPTMTLGECKSAVKPSIFRKNEGFRPSL
jgi:hypothetical protein